MEKYNKSNHRIKELKKQLSKEDMELIGRHLSQMAINRSHLIGLMNSGTGIGVEMFDELRMYPLESGMFSVNTLDHEKEFRLAEEAVDYFLELRNDLKLGFNFEQRRDY